MRTAMTSAIGRGRYAQTIADKLTALDGKLVALYVASDPATGQTEVSLYTDDGHGNGEGILDVDLGVLVAAATACAATKGWIGDVT